jgi:UDP-N-acetyl-D-mannosaminuronic acid dehydrogenase
MKYDICVLGLGYIGLPTASIIATKGKKVLGVDVSPRVVDTINSGEIHIEEPDLDVLVRAAIHSGNLVAAIKPEEADVFIIAVPTPTRTLNDGSKQPDLSYVRAAAMSIVEVVRTNSLVILESTSPVGTTQKVKEWLEEAAASRGIDLCSLKVMYAHCPERILPGQMLKELVNNDRIVGGLNSGASEAAKSIYEIFCTGQIVITDARTAELAKLTENAFRDVNIAFANELSMICDHLDINVWELIKLANHHPRVNILQPGPGVGGHCIAVDPWFIVSAAPDHSRLIKSAREVNTIKTDWVVDKVLEKARNFSNPKICCFGVSFKANVDDIRESPALKVVERLLEHSKNSVFIVDPHVEKLPDHFEGRCLKVDIVQALEQGDIFLLLVDHREFLNVNIPEKKICFDTRGVW